jgi:hypothetical protein
MLKTFIGLCLTLLSSSAFAKIYIVNIQGASEFELYNQSRSAITHVIGEIGNGRGCFGSSSAIKASNSDGTCSTCPAGSVEKSCRFRQIDPATDLIIRFYSTTTQPAIALLLDGNGLVLAKGSANSAVDANQLVTLHVPWSQVCASLSGDATCRTASFGMLRVGLDTNANNLIDDRGEDAKDILATIH